MAAHRFVERLEDRRARADLVGQRRQVELDAFAGIALALAVERLMLAVLLKQDHRQQVGAAQPRATTWNGAGGWPMLSQARQVNFSRTVWITFHCRGTTSSVSVTSSPILASRSAAARAGRRTGHHDALARQVLGERLASCLPARERLWCRLPSRPRAHPRSPWLRVPRAAVPSGRASAPRARSVVRT